MTTLVKDPDYFGNINFYVTADNPSGPWSDPNIIEGAPGDGYGQWSAYRSKIYSS